MQENIQAGLLQGGTLDTRKVWVPANRYTPLKDNWMKIFTPIVEHLHLQIRFNVKTRNVEIKVPGYNKLTNIFLIRKYLIKVIQVQQREKSPYIDVIIDYDKTDLCGIIWGTIAYRLEGRTLNRENPVSNPTAVASNLWQV